MLQLSPTLRSVLWGLLSLILFPIAYISLGWGSTLADRYTLALAPFGAAVYSVSLIIAARSGRKWLLVTIVALGVLLGACVLLICVENFVYAMPNRRWIPVVVILVLVVNCVGLAAFFKAHRRPAAADQSDSATTL
jgi:hypothetical protein